MDTYLTSLDTSYSRVFVLLIYHVLNVRSGVNNSWIKTYNPEETSDTVLALHAKSRKVFCLIDFGAPNNNSNKKADRWLIRLSLAIATTFKAKNCK